jgi:CPA1 family monovalent cation:H+ antiporter
MAAAGFRGAVSLAAALAVPTVTSSGGAFPARDLIVFATAGVIAVTLLVQAPLLPRVVRWARLPADNGAEAEWRRAYRTATEQALKALPRLAAERGIRPEVAEALRGEYDRLLRGLGSGDDDATGWVDQYARLRRALIADKHDTVVRLRDQGQIDDEVLLRLQDGLDTEAVHLDRDRPPEPE